MSTIMSKQGCAGLYPVLWEIVYDYEFQVRTQPDAFGDTEHSHFTAREGVNHIVAASEELARAAWRVKHPLKTSTIKSVSRLLFVDCVVGGV